VGLLDQPYDANDKVALFDQLQRFLINEYAQGRRTVLIIDEAQNLGINTLEELRMLSNINADKDQLLQMVLVGQPQLKHLLSRPELEQFAQRVSADFSHRAAGCGRDRGLYPPPPARGGA
jgi:general secretion pathway protein A